MRKLVILLFLFGCFLAQSQETTKVRFYVKGSSTFFVRLDGELLPESNIHSITPGEHKIEIWSPTFKTFSGKIVVDQGKDSISYFKELKQDQSYVDYLFELDEYKKQLFYRRTAPIMLAGAGAIALPFVYQLRRNNHEIQVIEEFKSVYNNSSAESAQTKYARANGLFFVSAGAVIVGSVAYLALRKNVKSLQRPIFRQENPFTLETFELSYNSISNAPVAGIKLNF